MSFEFPVIKQFGSRKFIIDIASNQLQLDEVFKLRYQIFNEELQEGLASSVANERDNDKFDEYCDQLIVIEADSEKIVGTYRLHRFDRALKGHGFYSSGEFDLSQLITGRYRLLEIGRACIAKNFRDGAVMTMLWYGLAHYMQKYNLDYLCGCASLEKGATIAQASLIFAYAKASDKIVAESFTVTPHQNIPGFDADLVIPDLALVKRSLPPLLRGYFTIGCKLAGPPAYDAEFGVIDFFVLFDFKAIANGPARRFIS